MSTLKDLKDRLNTYLRLGREKILGVNNERLEFIMDSFYKLDPTYRNGVLAAMIGLIITFVMLAVFIYFMQVRALRHELNDTFNALSELKALKVEESSESQRFDNLIERIGSKTRSINFKPFFEKLSRNAKIPIKNLAEKQPEMDPQNPLAKRLQEVHIDMRLSKVSIPRLLNFLVDIEKSNYYLRLQNLKVTGIYGNKLYFDVDLLVRGYKVIN